MDRYQRYDLDLEEPRGIPSQADLQAVKRFPLEDGIHGILQLGVHEDFLDGSFFPLDLAAQEVPQERVDQGD